MTNSLVKVCLDHCRALPYTYLVSNHLIQQAAQSEQSVHYDPNIVLSELQNTSGVQRFLPGNKQSLSSLSDTVAVQLGCSDFTDVVEINAGNKKYYLNNKTILQKAQRLNAILEKLTPLADDATKLKEPLIDVNSFKNSVLDNPDDTLPFKAEIELLFKIINESSSAIKNQVAQEFKELTVLPLDSTEQAEQYFIKYFELRQKLISQLYNGDTKALGGKLLNRLSLSNIDGTIDEARDFFTISNSEEQLLLPTDSNLDHEKINRFRKYFSDRLRALKGLRHTSTEAAVESAFNGLSKIDGKKAIIRASQIISGTVIPGITRFIREEVIGQDYETFKKRASALCNGEIPHEDTLKQIFHRIKEKAPGAIERVEQEAVELANRNVVTEDEVEQYKKDCIQLTSKARDLIILYTHGLNDNLHQAVKEELVELPNALYTYVQDYSHLIAAIPLIGLLSHISKDSFDAVSSLATAAANGGEMNPEVILPIVAQVLGDIPTSGYGQIANVGNRVFQSEAVREFIAGSTEIPEDVLEIIQRNGKIAEQMASEPAVANYYKRLCKHIADKKLIKKEDIAKAAMKVAADIPSSEYGQLAKLSISILQDADIRKLISDEANVVEILEIIGNNGDLIEQIISEPAVGKLQQKICNHFAAGGSLEEKEDLIKLIGEEDVEGLIKVLSKHPDIFLKILSLQQVKDNIISSIPPEISQDAVKALLEDEQVIRAIISNPSLHKVAKPAVINLLLKEGEKDISSILNGIEQKDVSNLLGLVYKHQKLKALLPNDKKIVWGGRLAYWALNGTIRNVALGIGGLISLGGLYIIRDDLVKGIFNGIGSAVFGATLAAFAKRTLVNKFLKMDFEDGWLSNKGGWGVAGASALLGIGSWAVSEHKFKGLFPAFGFGILGVILGASSNTASSIVGFPSKLKGYSGNDGLAFQILKKEAAESL